MFQTGPPQVLADQGAIMIGSPDSSLSATASGLAPLQPPGSAAAAAAAAVAAVGAAPGVTPNRGVSLADPTGGAGGVGAGAAPLGPGAGGIHSWEVQLVLEYCDRGCLRDALDAGAFFSAEGERLGRGEAGPGWVGRGAASIQRGNQWIRQEGLNAGFSARVVCATPCCVPHAFLCLLP